MPEPSPARSAPTLVLESWDGPWDEDDPDANLKQDIALYTKTDPLVTVTTLGNRIGVPPGALVRYVLARWASAGSAALLEVGPHMIERLWELVDAPETDEEKLVAFDQLEEMIRWLRLPLVSDVRYAD